MALRQKLKKHFTTSPNEGADVAELQRLAEDLRQTSELLRADYAALKQLNEVGVALLQPVELESLLGIIIDAAISITHAPMGTIHLYDDATQSLQIVAHRGFSSTFLDHFSRVDTGGWGEIIRLRERIFVDCVEESPIFRENPDAVAVLREAGVGALQSTPLIGQDARLLGRFSTHWSQPHRPDERTFQMLDLLARMASTVIENRQREQALREANEAARKANRVKDEFLATLSHELRTPLTITLSWAQMLRSGRLTPEQAAHGLEILEQSAKAQGQLIDDLLDLSRIQAGKLALNLQEIDPAQTLQTALDYARGLAASKQIQIEASIEPTEGKVIADPVRLQQVLWNLLNNALKFTPAGGKIELKVARCQATQGEVVQIQVCDTGRGIREDFLPHVFEQFSQADSSPSRIHGGLGLGLALVRKLVEMHGGQVDAKSAGEGKGTTITFSLPLCPETGEASLKPSAVSAEISRSPRLDGMRILVVDDEAHSREVFSVILRAYGAEVRTADCAKVALSVLPEFNPDVLVSDIGMPREDGFSLMRKVRALEGKLGQVPSLALTAYAGSEDAIRAKAAGFQAHLPKPVDSRKLVCAIARLAGRSELPLTQPS